MKSPCRRFRDLVVPANLHERRKKGLCGRTDGRPKEGKLALQDNVAAVRRRRGRGVRKFRKNGRPVVAGLPYHGICEEDARQDGLAGFPL